MCAEVLDVIETPLDLAKPETLATNLSQVPELDGIIHCAGVSEVASVADGSHEMWTHTMAVNVTGPAELTRVVLRHCARHRAVWCSSNAVADLHAVPNWSAYTASKAALRELADSLRLEEAAAGVRVRSFYPGGVATDLLRKVRTQTGRPYDPNACTSAKSLARIVIDALEVPPDSMMTGFAVSPPRPRT